MGKKIRYEKNAPLEPNDKVIAIHMDDEFSPVPGGMPGVVKSVANVFGLKQYYVNWRSGSRLALIDGRICKQCGNEQGSEFPECMKIVDKRTGETCGSTELEPIDQWRKVVEIDDESENINESVLFFKTKKQIIKECKK